MLQPNKVKYRKVHRPTIVKDVRGDKGAYINFGEYGLKVLEGGLLRSRELMAGRMAIKRGLKKKGGQWLRVFSDIPITGKKSGVRMGKGKGNVEYWVAEVKPGEVLFEIGGVNKKMAKKVLEVVGSKISLKTKVVEFKE